MVKRTLATVLWFAAATATWNALAFVLGWTDAIGPVIGIVAALFVAADPMHLFWPVRPKARMVERLSAAGVIQA